MQTYHECLPCFVKQTLSILEMIQLDDNRREETLRCVLSKMSTIDFNLSPPVMARDIHHLIRQASGIDDPYLAQKERDQQLALQLLPPLEQDVLMADNQLYAAVLLAIAGNSIDHGVYHGMSVDQILVNIEQGLKSQLHGDIEEFSRAIQQADNILYLGDNAGEIVFDKVLVQQLPLDKTTFVVRGGPILNDALLSDAEQAGITELVPVIDNGDISPGTVLRYGSPAFIEKFNQADLIIAKGQGNYETLSDSDANIYFLLKAKCPVVARHIGCEVGAALLYKKRCELE